MHRTATLVLSAALLALGVAMVVTTVARGGGPLAYGVVLGLLFTAAGAARLWVARREG
jgi:hypothetical protein